MLVWDVGDFVPLQYCTILGDFVPHIGFIVIMAVFNYSQQGLLIQDRSGTK